MAEPNVQSNRAQAILDRQRSAHLKDGPASAETRIRRLDQCIELLSTHADELCQAMNADFGHRSQDQSMLTDITATIQSLRFARKHLRKWMKPEKRAVQFPLNLLGAKAGVHFQAKGVVGIISPWNFPVNLCFSPLAGVLAAGNRAMIKPSEFTAQTSALIARLAGEYFSEDEVAIVTGGPEVAMAFSSLPFDHLVFTGSASVARHVMRAAAENLVPVTLELGGKCPAIIGRTADMEKAAMKMMAGKTLNAGQVCLAPDYVLVPQDKVEEFIEAAKRAIKVMFPDGLLHNKDYTSVSGHRYHDRLRRLLEDAESKGARSIEINPLNERFDGQSHYKMAPHIIVNTNDDMTIMQDEIFGPILPVVAYTETAEAVGRVNAGPRPLGLYYFGTNKPEQEYILANTTTGGVSINDVIFHAGEEDLPFGGIGTSGTGAYHGRDGFYEFSHKKAVYNQIGPDLLSMVRPPYGEKFRKLIRYRLKH